MTPLADKCICTIGVNSDCPEHGHGEEGARLTAGIRRVREAQARAELERLRRWDAQPARVKLGQVLDMMEDTHFPDHYIKFVRSIFYAKRKRR